MTMMEQVSAWFGRANVTVDLGNLSVGLATLSLALITIFLALRSSKHDARGKIAELRHGWIGCLRDSFNRFNTASFEVLIYCGRGPANQKMSFARDETISPLFVIMLREQSEIMLRLNPREKLNKDIVKSMRRFYALHAKLEDFKTLNSEDRNKRIREIVKERKLLISLQSHVLKFEWDRLRDEIHGRKIGWSQKALNFFLMKSKRNERWWDEDDVAPNILKED